MVIARNLEPRLVGGHVALDLVNTVAPRLPGADQVEYLSTPADLLSWAMRVGLVEPSEAAPIRSAWDHSSPTADQALHAAIDIREAAYDVLMAALAAGAEPPTAESATAESVTAGAATVMSGLERLSLRWAAATARSELVLAESAGPAVRLSVGTTPAMLIPDRLAHAVVDLLRTVELHSLRVCPVAEGGCGWLFVDHSRNGSRRWCSMADCGAQAKSRRLTARRRGARATIRTDAES